MGKRSITTVIVGAGDRGMTYASYALEYPETLSIVGVVDPNEKRRKRAADLFNIEERFCFKSISELIKLPKMADAVINGTMDKDHVPTTLPLLEKGYDILLEKPIAVSMEEMEDLVEAWKRSKSKIMVGHVLRYAPFYRAIHREISKGVIGDIINIETAEYISYDHMGVAYLRGKWKSKEICGSSILMSKCCHDLDLITWLKGDIRPVEVVSFGTNNRFKAENAPVGSGYRCLVDCKIEKKCPFSAKKNYIDNPERWANYVWSERESFNYLSKLKLSKAEMEKSLKLNNPYGICVWKAGSDVMDHQTVLIKFRDGSTATHLLVGGTSTGSRSIKITGTKGEIEGCLENAFFTVKLIQSNPNMEISFKTIDVSMEGVSGQHGGGDMRLVRGFIEFVSGDYKNSTNTSIEHSIYGHLIGFYADKARVDNKVYEIPQIENLKKQMIDLKQI